MERATVMKTFHGNLTPKSPPPTLRDRDASFSSYLQPHHHHHTIGSDQCKALDDSTAELSIFDAHKYFNEVANNDNNIHKVTTTPVISNSNNNNSSNNRVSPHVTNNTDIMEGSKIITETTTRYSSASSSVDGYGNMMRNNRARSFHAATPTASSEASWNSQTGLLSHPKGAIPDSMITITNPSNSKNPKARTYFSKPIWFLRKKCPCNGKKSVQVKEPKITQIPPPRDHHSLNLERQQQQQQQQNHDHTLKNNIIPITPNNWVVSTTKSRRFHNSQSQSHQIATSSNGFTFPVLNPNSSNTKAKLQLQNGFVLEKELDPARDSLEVFQPPINNDDTMEIATVSLSPNTSRVNDVMMIDEDAESDASSDLFEIESFSTTTITTTTTTTAMQSSYPAAMYRRRDSMDDASSNNGFFFCRRSMDERSTAMATECYEPSEASIEWSVTTVAAEEESSIGAAAVRGHGGGERWKKKGSLVSCRSEKAVSVGPQPVVRSVEGQRGATCSSRHDGVNSGFKIGGVVSVNKPPRSNTKTLPLSLAFAT